MQTVLTQKAGLPFKGGLAFLLGKEVWFEERARRRGVDYSAYR